MMENFDKWSQKKARKTIDYAKNNSENFDYKVGCLVTTNESDIVWKIKEFLENDEVLLYLPDGEEKIVYKNGMTSVSIALDHAKQTSEKIKQDILDHDFNENHRNN